MPDMSEMMGGGDPSAKIQQFMTQLMGQHPDLKGKFEENGTPLPGQEPATPDVSDAYGQSGAGPRQSADPTFPGLAKKSSTDGPKFRDQGNAHDTETAQISDLINQLDQSQKNDMHSAHQQRAAQLWAKAGNAVAHGFAPDVVPSIANEPLVDLPKEGDAKLKQMDMKERLKQDLFKRENPEEERRNKQLLQDHKLLADYDALQTKTGSNEKIAGDKAVAHDKEFQQRDRTSRDNNAASNTARIASAEIGAGAQAGSRVAEKGAAEEYDQAEKSNRQTYDGQAFHARGSLSSDQASKFDKVLDNYGLIGPALDRIQELMAKDPRGIAKWGADARTTLISALTSAGEATVKNNGDGVVTGKDMDHALSQLGSPQGFENFVAANGGAGLKEFKQMITRQLKARAVSAGYDEGPGQSNKLEDVHKRAAAFGTSQSQGGRKPNVKSQDAIDAVEAAAHGKHAVLHGRDEDQPTQNGGGADLSFEETKTIDGKTYGRSGKDWYLTHGD